MSSGRGALGGPRRLFHQDKAFGHLDEVLPHSDKLNPDVSMVTYSALNALSASHSDEPHARSDEELLR